MSRLQQMRDEDAASIARNIADDLEFLRTALDGSLETILTAEPGPERDGLIACNRQARSALAELPARIAAHGPFTDYAAAEAAGRIETMRVLSILDGTGMPTSGSA
jgi:hypothetical protein